MYVSEKIIYDPIQSFGRYSKMQIWNLNTPEKKKKKKSTYLEDKKKT